MQDRIGQFLLASGTPREEGSETRCLDWRRWLYLSCVESSVESLEAVGVWSLDGGRNRVLAGVEPGVELLEFLFDVHKWNGHVLAGVGGGSQN